MFYILSFMIPFTVCFIKLISDGYGAGEAFSMSLIGGFMILFLIVSSSLDDANGGKGRRYSGIAESAHYNTDYATGEQIALLKDINDKLNEEKK